MFHTGLSIGENVSHDKIVKIFKCGNMGGMRKSSATNTLVIISDHTKGLYQDQWKDGILHYTGMGKVGDQVLKGNQNATLYYSDTNNYEVHLFEVLEKTVYTYRGTVELAEKPYQEKQPDSNGEMRKVWIFPLKSTCDSTDSINEFNIPEIRLIPMSIDEFDHTSIEEIQKEFFLNDLVYRENCGYYYRERGLRSQNNALLLFQMCSKIIASARLYDVIEDDRYEGYKGAYQLYPESIRVFEPITLEDLRTILPEFTGFTQSKQSIEIKHIHAILRLIDKKVNHYQLGDTGISIVTDAAEENAEDLDSIELIKRIENNCIPMKTRKAETNIYYRDPYLKVLVKRLADGKCQLCGQKAPFLNTYGEPYLEEHHVKKLGDGGSDEIENVVALCPNCHRKIHILNDEDDVNTLVAVASSNAKNVEYLKTQEMYKNSFENEQNYDFNQYLGEWDV